MTTAAADTEVEAPPRFSWALLPAFGVSLSGFLLFGLQHEQQWNGSTLASEYYYGPGDGTAPIMGDSYGAARSLWWYGTSGSGRWYW